MHVYLELSITGLNMAYYQVNMHEIAALQSHRMNAYSEVCQIVLFQDTLDGAYSQGKHELTTRQEKLGWLF